MNTPEEISDELLNALADRELAQTDYDRLLAIVLQTPALQARYDEVCELKKMMRTAYKDIPPAPAQQAKTRPVTTGFSMPRYPAYLSAAALLLLGLAIGWVFKPAPQTTALSFQNINNILPGSIENKNVLLHINSMEEKQVRRALETASLLLDSYLNKQNKFNIEVVANAEGLGVLRMSSPYADQIASLTAKSSNIKFLACGIAKQTAMLKEKGEIKLLPEAVEIPAALDRIILRLKDGWTYVKGD